ncbi:tRNA (N(6)-L-threonylcarbamoyladenosine(37)-C(2))-methylthiotransferase [Candidatus Pacearchaeota archaeon]|nr:tRNA (N(6)-L-threonylcarbamoyladenosine(37)-C(2))-methylthiotransferase [Candidatus Pacearchaeota archaeon]
MYKFVYIETYGCSANQNNSEILRGKLKEAGLDFTENPEIADILILNTCIVKGPTENRMKSRIIELGKLGKPLIVTGCLPSVRKIISPNIYILGINNITKITKLIKKISEKRYQQKEFLSSNKEIKLNCSKIRNNKLIGITQISEGCLGNCSYCITKLVKKDMFSYPEEKIIENIKQDLKNGCREIWLTSQDNAAFGKDSGTNLINLLKKILEIDSKFKLRLGMMNPDNVFPVLDELIEIYKNEKMYKFLHVPVQSGSNSVLRRMNRKYTIRQFEEIIKKFRKKIPNITIATDIISAYPGETCEDNEKNLKLIREIKPEVLNLTRYWAKQGTRAACEKQVESKIARKRTLELQKLHLKINLEENEKLENSEQEVFVNEKQGKVYFARTKNYKIVIIKSEKNILGKTIKVRIKQAFSHYFLAS